MPPAAVPPLDVAALLPDILPIAQNDGATPLAQIAYADAYADAMGYLRALMAADELSARALLVTQHVIAMNPAHYTCWGWRLRCVLALASRASSEGVEGEVAGLRAEIEWVDGVAILHEKNYQIWHHRQMVMERLYQVVRRGEGDVDGEKVLGEVLRHERAFTARMFGLDAKNYHVWSYRQWLVRRFDLFDKPGSGATGAEEELRYVEELLRADVRNNSAWNHRFFVVFGASGAGAGARPATCDVDAALVEREAQFASRALALAPGNASAWNYLRGICSHTRTPLATLLAPLALRYAPLSAATGQPEGDVLSAQALDVLVDIYEELKKAEGADGAEVEAAKRRADVALQLLKERYDPVRANYWEWRRREVLGA